MCGEKFGKWSTKGRITGSPPYVRGKEQGQVMPGFAFGITPAYAGKRPVTRPLAVSDRDHPRMCGEKRTARCGMQASAGSPPHMRGKVLLHTDGLP